MPCDRIKSFIGQSVQQRLDEIKEVAEGVGEGISKGRIKVVVGKQGAVAFQGLEEANRRKVSDACIYRKLRQSKSAIVRMKLAEAEAQSGNRIDMQTVAGGLHSHDGGKSWERH